MAKHAAEKVWLSKSIKGIYKRINTLTMKTYNAQLTLSKIFHRIEYNNILNQVDKKTENHIREKTKNINKKLNKLKTVKRDQIIKRTSKTPISSKHIFFKRIENLTNVEFNEDEVKLLNKGLKHNIATKNNRKERTNHLLDIESAILRTDKNHQEDIRTLFVNEYNTKIGNNTMRNSPTSDITIIENIKKKLKENNAIITKADKGNTAVIMLLSDYNHKIADYITSNNIQKLSNDPTRKYHKAINAAISRSTNIQSRYQIHSNKMIKPRAPIISGLPKIHKESMPIRPLINFTTSPSFKIAKHLNSWLTTHITLPINHSVTNNLELIDKIESIHIPNGAKLASFDVTNMYSNIPVNETIKIIHNNLIINKMDNKIVTEVIDILNVITKQNYFEHENECYSQQEGLPMGSPLSGTLANIYLNHIERTHILNIKNKHHNNILYWHRYVDDILLLFKGTLRQLDQLHHFINNIHNNIKFTLEIESEKTINFLDLTIKNDNQKHNFKIHRKSTQTDQTIHNLSQHPYQQKIAAYHHMLNRLNNIPMTVADYNDELNTIKFIANNNGYSENLIDNINTKILNKIHITNLTTLKFNESDKKYVTIEYNKTTHNIIGKILKNYGYMAAYTTSNKIQRKLKENRNIVQLESGIYKLNCNDCQKFYLGQTGRSFEIRFKEHTDEVTTTQTKNIYHSNYAYHLVTENHTYTNIKQNLQVLHRLKKGNKMNILEEWEIYKQRHNQFLLNDKINTKTNKIFDLITKNQTSTSRESSRRQ